MKYSAGYGIFVGVLIIAQWAVSITTGGVPEFRTTPWAIGFHLAAEFFTALMLIAGGIGMMKSTDWGKKILILGLGMVIYSEIASPGYFAEQGQWALVGMFVVLLVGAVLAVKSVRISA